MTPRTTAEESTVLADYIATRRATRKLSEPLSPEDTVAQSMPDASPAKWHLAHTTWFFETFVLAAQDGYRPFRDEYRVLFNSYYNTIGEQHARPERGLVTRPGLKEVLEYRHHVDSAMAATLDSGKPAGVVELGINHEQQHQELMLTDIKHLFSCNPLYPAYHTNGAPGPDSDRAPDLKWLTFEGGTRHIGHDGNGFSFDNERPRHDEVIRPFELASRLITNAEFREFMQEGGYERPELWLSDGWSTVMKQRWSSPLYWVHRDGVWHEFTLRGLRPVDPAEPVVHVSYYEADAFARWSGARLPTEAEWEVAAGSVPVKGNLAESWSLHPGPAPHSDGLEQMFGDAWEWTMSAYSPYPGYAPPVGALGEYNGKFMCNQLVLRGGSCVTPSTHIRPTYRNFFYPPDRWQFSGFRLARSPR